VREGGGVQVKFQFPFLQKKKKKLFLRFYISQRSSGPDGKDSTKGAVLSVQRALRTISWVLRFLVAGSSRVVSSFHFTRLRAIDTMNLNTVICRICDLPH